MFGLIGFLIVGLIAGYIASRVMKSNHGLLMNLLVGVIGAFVGGFLFQLVGFDAVGVVADLIVASVGAIVLLFVMRRLRA